MSTESIRNLASSNGNSRLPYDPPVGNGVTPQEGSNKLPLVIAALKNKAITVESNVEYYTAESWEVHRKIRLLEQFKIARRLRAVLEHAANEAESGSVNQARNIMHRHVRDINELVCLTEAARTNKTQDSYHNYNVEAKKQNRRKQVELKNAKKVVKNQLLCMAKERNPEVSGQDPDLDEDSLDSGVHEVAAALRDLSGKNHAEDSGLSDEEYNIPSGIAADYMMNIKSDEKKKLPAPKKKLPKMAAKGSSTVKQTRKHGIKGSIPPICDEEPENVRKTMIADSSSVSFDTQPKKKAPKLTDKSKHLSSMKPKANKKRKITSSQVDSSLPKSNVAPKKSPKIVCNPRKCHLCKKTNKHYLRCNFWFLNGTQCGKVYCKECMTEKFKLENFEATMNDPEWHCPSCLGTCQCAVCVKKRERTDRRGFNSDRRSTAKTAAGFYSFLT